MNGLDLRAVSGAYARGILELEHYTDELRREAADLNALDPKAATELRRAAGRTSLAIAHLLAAEKRLSQLAGGSL